MFGLNYLFAQRALAPRFAIRFMYAFPRFFTTAKPPRRPSSEALLFADLLLMFLLIVFG